jgi:hypothetical protein
MSENIAAPCTAGEGLNFDSPRQFVRARNRATPLLSIQIEGETKWLM